VGDALKGRLRNKISNRVSSPIHQVKPVRAKKIPTTRNGDAVMEIVSIEKDELSAILKPLVAGRNMTQIAKKIGIGDASFRSYVNGKALPSANALNAIAKYFNIPISKLTGSEKPKENLENIKDRLKELEAEEKKKIISWLVENL